MFDFNKSKATIRAYGIIGDDITEQGFMEAFDAMDGEDVSIVLQSDGGNVMTGLSIYNQIANYAGRVTVHIDAMAASIASVFPMAAAHVTANKNSTVMVHDAWALALGNAGEFRDVADVLDQLSDGIAEIYSDRTGMPAEDWRDIMRNEKYFTAPEALKHGLIDQINGSEAESKAAAKRNPIATISSDLAAALHGASPAFAARLVKKPTETLHSRAYTDMVAKAMRMRLK